MGSILVVDHCPGEMGDKHQVPFTTFASDCLSRKTLPQLLVANHREGKLTKFPTEGLQENHALQ